VRPRVTVVGLGPGGVDLINAATSEAIEAAGIRVLRTARHPAAVAVRDAVTCDDIYDHAARIDDVYPAIVERVVGLAAVHGDVLYAVPGAADVAERSVELLRSDVRIEVQVIPAMSFLDLTWARLAVDPLAAGVRIVDGYRFALDAAGQSGPLLVCQCDSVEVLSDIKLAVEEPPDVAVQVLQRLGLPDESIRAVAWEDLDRDIDADHLTSLWIPELADPVAAEFQRFDDLVRVLRQRCPWDRDQTHESLVRYLLEETYEVVDAISSGDPDDLEEELGDLLFQVVFHAAIATEDGWFTMADVARRVHDKLVARHPHVFDDGPELSTDELRRQWEDIKRAEKGRTSTMDGVPRSMPARLYAETVRRKALRVGIATPELDPAERRAEQAETALRRVVDAVVSRVRSEGR